DAVGTGCHAVWHSGETAPTVVPKLSAANGIVYTYTKDVVASDPQADAWYLTALDFRTGRTLWKRLGGEGLGHNNNYAPVTLGPDATAYVGVLGGLVALRDATAPPNKTAPPRVRLNVRRFHDGRLRLSLGGADRHSVKQAAYRAGRIHRTATKAPFRVIIATRAHAVRATVTMSDNRRIALKRTVKK